MFVYWLVGLFWKLKGIELFWIVILSKLVDLMDFNIVLVWIGGIIRFCKV